MNKATKGAVAAGAAALLLAGGAGTMAAWNASAPMTGGTIKAGSLNLTALGTPTWNVNGTDLGAGAIATYRVSPGDVVIYKGSVTVGIVGDNLEANIVADTSTIDGALVSALDITTETKVGDTVVSKLDDTATTVDVVVTFDFPKGAIVTTPNNDANNASQGTSASLANFNVKLEQV